MIERQHFAIPSIAEDALGRLALSAWLDANARVPLRYVVGQPGAGKTTAVAAWARQQSSSIAWVTLRDGAAEGAVFALLTDVLAECVEWERGLTIIIDDVDRAAAGTREMLAQLYLLAAESVTFIYIARAFTAVDVSEGEQRGVAAVASAAQLRFTAQEIALYCEARSVACTPVDAALIVAATDGWALSVTGIVRAAHIARCSLSEALALWKPANLKPIERVVAEAVKSASASDARDLLDLLDGRAVPTTAALRRLSRAGLFVDRIDGRFARNPIVFGLTETPESAAAGRSPLVLEMFGRFRVLHDGTAVHFVRRRDAQIVQYLALQPDARATRSKLIRTFWPDADPQVGAQGLRTACSAIRRAIAARVGTDAVDRYLFSAPAQIGLRPAVVVSSAQRFAAHSELAIAAEARDATASAAEHWAAALALYTAPVLSGEPVAWWIEQRAEAFAGLAQRARRSVRERGHARVR